MITHIGDHVDQALARLLSHTEEHTNLRSIVSLLSSGIQELEDVLYALLTDTTFDLATGAALDQWGALVGEARDGLDDSEYKKFILARAATRNSHGKAEELLYILNTIANPLVVHHFDLQPAHVRLEYVHTEYADLSKRRRITKQIERAKSAGVSVSIVEVPVGTATGSGGESGYFGFLGNPAARGFGVGTFSRRIDDD